MQLADCCHFQSSYVQRISNVRRLHQTILSLVQSFIGKSMYCLSKLLTLKIDLTSICNRF